MIYYVLVKNAVKMHLKITLDNRQTRLELLTGNRSTTASLFANIPGYLKNAVNY